MVARDMTLVRTCHSRAGGNLFIKTSEARVNSQWIPACAGMTALGNEVPVQSIQFALETLLAILKP